MFFYNQVIMAEPQQSQQDQETVIKTRISHLKAYLNEIKQSAPQIQFLYKRKSITPKKHFSKKANQVIQHEILKRQQLKKEIKRIKSNIEEKVKMFTAHESSDVKDISQTSQICYKGNSSIIFVYHSRIPMIQPLPTLIQLLKGHEWTESKIFTSKFTLILLSSSELETKSITFSQIINQSLSQHMNFIKFIYQQVNFIFSFLTERQALNWYQFLKIISDKQVYSVTNKWNLTSISCPQSQKSKPSQKIRIIQQSQSKQKTIEKKSKQKVPDRISPSSNINMSIKSRKNSIGKNSIGKKISIDSSIFNLSNSSETLQNSKILKNRQDQLAESIRFQVIPEQFNSRRQTVHIGKTTSQIEDNWMGNLENSPTLPFDGKKQSILLTIKLLNKLEEKKKLLSENSYSNLGIYWHEDEQQKSNVNNHHFETQSIENNEMYSPQEIRMTSSKKQSGNLKKYRDSSLSSPNKIKRVQSATRDKSNSRDSSQIQFQNKNRKKTDFSLQLQPVELTQKKKSSKRQIRDNYLRRLIQKQSIKQSSKNSQVKKQTLLIPIPQKSPQKLRRPSTVTISNHSSKQHTKSQQNEMSVDQYSESAGQRQSTQLEIQIQELKNGIILQKCSKNSWGIKDKRLYISNAMAQLCYCDPQDSSNQKRIHLKDVKSIEFGRVSKGILKHKKSYQNNRCLLIRITKHGKQKLLEFYLQESQPCQNLKQFVTKLQKFTQMQKDQEYSSGD